MQVHGSIKSRGDCGEGIVFRNLNYYERKIIATGNFATIWAV